MSHYENMRLYINEGAYNGSLTPQPETQNSGWGVPGHPHRDIFGNGMSAVCWFCKCIHTCIRAYAGRCALLTTALLRWLKLALCVVVIAVGRDLYSSLDPPRPIGLIVSSVGGSTDQSWSSPDALDQCRHHKTQPKNASRWWQWPANVTASQLWNSKIVPLLRTVVKGVVWCAWTR